MINNNSLESIIANGGWCDINSKRDTPLIKQLNGRILFNAIDFLLIHRFNLELETLDGFYIFYKPNVKKLQKGYWIKKYLTVAGKMLENIDPPAPFVASNWFELLGNLQRSKDLLKFKLGSEDVFGSIRNYTSSEIRLLPAFLTPNSTEKSIVSANLICLEARTREIVRVSKDSRRQKK